MTHFKMYFKDNLLKLKYTCYPIFIKWSRFFDCILSAVNLEKLKHERGVGWIKPFKVQNYVHTFKNDFGHTFSIIIMLCMNYEQTI